jgi:hypothetical protein
VRKKRFIYTEDPNGKYYRSVGGSIYKASNDMDPHDHPRLRLEVDFIEVPDPQPASVLYEVDPEGDYWSSGEGNFVSIAAWPIPEGATRYRRREVFVAKP